MVDTTAKELLIPGAVVLLRTPQGEFTVTYGTTLLGAITHPAPTPTSGSPPIPRR
jgi:D-alanyl-D-alanine carboxypeptidase